MSTPPPSQKDGQQVLKYAFDDVTGKLRVDATISPSGSDLEIDHTDDSIAIGTSTDLFTATTIGPKIGLDVNVINTIPLSVDISASSSDNIAIANQLGTHTMEVNADGSINITDNGGSLTVDGSVSVTNFPATQPISAVSLPLPTGASTEAKQDTGNTSLASIDSKLTSPITVTGPLTDAQLRATAVPVSGTVAVTQSTSPWVENVSQFGGNNVVTGTGASGSGIPRVTVSNDSDILATQSGTWVVTANAGTNLNTSALALNTTVSGLQVSQGSTTSGELGPLVQGAVTTAAPTYVNNQTNPLSLTTTGALRTDSSATTQPISGTVAATQSTSPWVISGTVTANAGTNLNTSALALDTSVTELNVALEELTQSQASTTSGQVGPLVLTATTTAAPTYTTTTSNPLSTTTAGALRVDNSAVTQPIRAGTGTLTDRSGTATATSTQFMAANTNRKFFFIQNLGNAPVYINFTSAASVGSGSIALSQFGVFVMEESFISTEAVNIIRSGGSNLIFTAKEG